MVNNDSYQGTFQKFHPIHRRICYAIGGSCQIVEHNEFDAWPEGGGEEGAGHALEEEEHEDELLAHGVGEHAQVQEVHHKQHTRRKAYVCPLLTEETVAFDAVDEEAEEHVTHHHGKQRAELILRTGLQEPVRPRSP